MPEEVWGILAVLLYLGPLILGFKLARPAKKRRMKDEKKEK